MGSARWDSSTWSSYTSTTVSGKSRAAVFTSRSLKPELDPKNVKVRESRDSALNPASTPIIVGFDVTGSMGQIPHSFVGGDGAKGGLGLLVEEILRRSTGSTPMVTDPHIMVMGIGDSTCDRAPLQMTQFEADIRIAEQLSDVWLEGGGGGNGGESYSLAWYAAAQRTSIDCFEKRGKKGYLFTVGDEPILLTTRKDEIKSVFGDEVPSDLSSADLLTLVARKYNVFHVVVEEGFYRYNADMVRTSWEPLLGGERVLYLPDHTKLAEVIVSAIQRFEGASLDDVGKSWSSSTSLVVMKAIKDIAPASAAASSGGLVRF